MPKCLFRTLLLASALGMSLSASARAAQPATPEASPEFSVGSTPGTRTLIVDLPLADGSRQRVMSVRPDKAKSTIVMLPGGSGRIGERRDGAVRHDANFLLRSVDMWTARGFAVLIPDAVDGALVDGLAAYARRTIGAPVFLMGTSQGAIAAMNGAAHARPGALAGLVLTESVSVQGHSGETVFSADPADVRVPAMVVANRADRCDVAPPGMAGKIAAAMVRAPDVKVLVVDSGPQGATEACSSRGPHGYAGIEDEVVDAIARWMEARLGSTRG